MSWDKRQLAAVGLIRAEVPDARISFFGGGGNWTYEGDGPSVMAIDYTDQHLGAPGYLHGIHCTGKGFDCWLSDDDLPAPPVLPDSQMRKSIYFCAGVDLNIQMDREARGWI
jgi:hypothetical protein